MESKRVYKKIYINYYKKKEINKHGGYKSWMMTRESEEHILDFDPITPFILSRQSKPRSNTYKDFDPLLESVEEKG